MPEVESKSESELNAPPAIRAMHVFSTGWGEQHKEHRYGSTKPQMWWVLTSRSWIKMPINAFLIEHRDGLILFDTGIDPAIISDSNYINVAIGRFLLKRIFRLHIAPEDRLRCKLEGLGIPPSKITKAVISHLHFDHVGGIADIPQTDLLVSEREWAQLSESHPDHEWILREHIELPGAKWTPIKFNPTDDPLFAPFGGCHDVMGDGAIILLPTPGHTPGSMSMLVRSATLPPILLIGDLAYDADCIFKDQAPGTGDAKLLRQSYAKVRALKAQMPDLIIVPSHDMQAMEKLNAILQNNSTVIAA